MNVFFRVDDLSYLLYVLSGVKIGRLFLVALSSFFVSSSIHASVF